MVFHIVAIGFSFNLFTVGTAHSSTSRTSPTRSKLLRASRTSLSMRAYVLRMGRIGVPTRPGQVPRVHRATVGALRVGTDRTRLSLAAPLEATEMMGRWSLMLSFWVGRMEGKLVRPLLLRLAPRSLLLKVMTCMSMSMSSLRLPLPLRLQPLLDFSSRRKIILYHQPPTNERPSGSVQCSHDTPRTAVSFVCIIMYG